MSDTQTYGKPADWTDREWETWQETLHMHMAAQQIIPARAVERLTSGTGIIAEMEYEGKRYKGILFQMDGENA